MDRMLEDFIDRSTTVRSVGELGTMLSDELAIEGFDNLVFASTRGRVLTEVVWANLPAGYAEAYMSEGWGQVDPILRHAFGTVRAFRWDSVLARTELTTPERRFLTASDDFGVRGGLTVPLHGPNGAVDLVSLSMRGVEPPPPTRLRRVHGVVLQAWLRRSELAAQAPVAALDLTAREVECLKWLKDGKSNWQIGQILRISEKTVEFHVANLMRKLNVESRLAAVLTAIRLGIIDL